MSVAHVKPWTPPLSDESRQDAPPAPQPKTEDGAKEQQKQQSTPLLLMKTARTELSGASALLENNAEERAKDNEELLSILERRKKDLEESKRRETEEFLNMSNRKPRAVPQYPARGCANRKSLAANTSSSSGLASVRAVNRPAQGPEDQNDKGKRNENATLDDDLAQNRQGAAFGHSGKAVGLEMRKPKVMQYDLEAGQGPKGFDQARDPEDEFLHHSPTKAQAIVDVLSAASERKGKASSLLLLKAAQICEATAGTHHAAQVLALEQAIEAMMEQHEEDRKAMIASVRDLEYQWIMHERAALAKQRREYERTIEHLERDVRTLNAERSRFLSRLHQEQLTAARALDDAKQEMKEKEEKKERVKRENRCEAATQAPDPEEIAEQLRLMMDHERNHRIWQQEQFFGGGHNTNNAAQTPRLPRLATPHQQQQGGTEYRATDSRQEGAESRSSTRSARTQQQQPHYPPGGMMKEALHSLFTNKDDVEALLQTNDYFKPRPPRVPEGSLSGLTHVPKAYQAISVQQSNGAALKGLSKKR